MVSDSLLLFTSGLTFNNDLLAVRVFYLATCGRSDARVAASTDKPVPNPYCLFTLAVNARLCYLLPLDLLTLLTFECCHDHFCLDLLTD